MYLQVHVHDEFGKHEKHHLGHVWEGEGKTITLPHTAKGNMEIFRVTRFTLQVGTCGRDALDGYVKLKNCAIFFC